MIALITNLSAAAQTQPAAIPQQPTPAETLEVPEGLEVTTWGASPQFFNPTNIDIDARGRVWVAEAVNYRETIKDHHALTHPDGDRIVILEDTDGDGSADSSKVFVQDKDLVAPLGIAVLGDKVVVSCSPNVFIYTDTDGDDRADHRKVFLTGWGGFDYDHGVHAFVGGLDGRWYFNCGNSGPHEVTDKSGWHLSSGSVFTSSDASNAGNRKSDDGRVWVGGLVMSVNPDGTGLTVHAHNFRNNFEVALDSFGDLWQTDNDDDGNQSCRMTWIMEGGNYGFFSVDGTRTWTADRRPGQSIQTAHWHQDDPGVVPSVEITGTGGPTGLVVYEGGLLRKEWIGSIFACDAGRNRVSIFKPIVSGAGFEFEQSDLIAPIADSDGNISDDARLFRPSDVAIGTDGAVYIADWYDPVVGGHNILDKQGGGRILRIAPKGAKPTPPTVDLESGEGRRNALSSPAINIRYAASEAYRALDPKAAREELKPANEWGDERLRARAMMVLGSIDNDPAESELALYAEGDRSDVAAFRILQTADPGKAISSIIESIERQPIGVVREAAIVMRDLKFEQCKDALVKIAERYDGKDPFFLEAFGIACDGKESQIYPLLVEKFGTTDSVDWSQRMIGLAWRLHPIESLEAFQKRATAATLSPEARVQAVTAIAFMNDERASEMMAELAVSDDDLVREQSLWWMHHRATNDWKDFAAAQSFIAGPASQPQARFSQDRMTLLDDAAPERKRISAAKKLAQDPEGAKIILALAAEGQYPEVLVESTTDALYRNPDLGVRALASQYFPRRNATGEPIPPIGELAKLEGDVARGKEVFIKLGGCVQCHKFNGEGNDIGPDLTTIRTKYGRPEILDAVLNPSAGIVLGYETWILKTRDNQVYAGFILADGETVTIKESSGEQRTIPASEISLRKKQEISVMPDNIATGLSAQQLADLVEYLLKADPEKKDQPQMDTDEEQHR